MTNVLHINKIVNKTRIKTDILSNVFAFLKKNTERIRIAVLL